MFMLKMLFNRAGRQYISTNAPKHNSVKNTNLNTT